MPDNSAYLATLAKGGHKIEGWFFPFDWGDPVLVADVTATPAFPTYNLAISVTSGSASAVDYGMVYTISTAGGLYKGMGTLRYAGTISSSNIPVRELSRGSIDVAAGDVIRVYRTFLPGDKLVGATADFNPDGLSYTDQGSNPPPVNNDLGAWAGKPSQLPIPFANSLGYVVDPDSSSAVTVVRTLPAGLSYATGDDTTLDVTVTGDEGTYWVKSVVTDPDNSKSTTRYTPVCINDSPLECTAEPYGGDRDNGWRMSVTFRGTVDIREGTWGAFAVRETMGGVDGSYGSAADGRSHVKFVGIVRRRSFDVDGTGARTVTYEFLSPLAWLLETPGFSKVMLDKASPSNWMEMKTLDTKRAKLQIIQFYSNLNQVGCDVVFRSNYRVKRYPGFFIEKNTPIGQLRELASGVGAVLICTRQGRFEFVTDPRLLPLASRSSVATMLALTNDHIIRASFQQEMKDTLEKMYFSGFVAGASGNAPFRIAFPGKAPGTGTQSPQFDKVICDSITAAEEEAGRRGGMVQQVFHGSNGQKHRVVTGELVLFGAFDVFDLYGEWITLPAIPNAAGIDTSAYRFVIDSISVEYTSGTARVTLRVSGETNAPKGQYDPPPVEAPASDLDYPWDLTAPVIITTGGRLPAWNGVNLVPTRLFTLAANTNKAHIARSWNPITSSPTYEDISTGLTGNGIWATSDPYDYRRRFALTADGLFRADDIWNFSTWSQVGTPTQVFGNAAGIGTSIMGSINRRGWFLIGTGNFCFAATPDYGATWYRINFATGTAAGYAHGTTLDELAPGIAVSPRNGSGSGNGRIYAVGGTPFGGNTTLFKSDNWGVDGSWSTVANNAALAFDGNIVATPRINIPYVRSDGTTPNTNDSSQELYMVAGDGTRGQLIFSDDAGATWTTVHYVNSGGATQKPHGNAAGYSIQTFTHNGAVVFYNGQNGVEFSTDGGNTQDFTGAVLPNATEYANGINGFSNHIGALIAWNRAGTGGHLIWSLEGGANSVSATLPSGVTHLAYAEWDLSELVPPAA